MHDFNKITRLASLDSGEGKWSISFPIMRYGLTQVTDSIDTNIYSLYKLSILKGVLFHYVCTE